MVTFNPFAFLLNTNLPTVQNNQDTSNNLSYNTTNELSGKTFSTINGSKSQVYTTGRVNGQGSVVTKLLSANGNIESQILPHHTFREARTDAIFPGMTEAQIQAVVS